eukprot:2518383-Pleurochrysis_carterae.AAC.1
MTIKKAARGRWQSLLSSHAERLQVPSPIDYSRGSACSYVLSSHFETAGYCASVAVADSQLTRTSISSHSKLVRHVRVDAGPQSGRAAHWRQLQHARTTGGRQDAQYGRDINELFAYVQIVGHPHLARAVDAFYQQKRAERRERDELPDLTAVSNLAEREAARTGGDFDTILAGLWAEAKQDNEIQRQIEAKEQEWADGDDAAVRHRKPRHKRRKAREKETLKVEL